MIDNGNIIVWLGILMVALVLALLALSLALLRLRKVHADNRVRFALMQAIVAGFKGAEWSTKTFGDYLTGADRELVARAAIERLPDEVRDLMPLHMWHRLIPEAYEAVSLIYRRNAKGFLREVEAIYEMNGDDY